MWYVVNDLGLNLNIAWTGIQKNNLFYKMASNLTYGKNQNKKIKTSLQNLEKKYDKFFLPTKLFGKNMFSCTEKHTLICFCQLLALNIKTAKY